MTRLIAAILLAAVALQAAAASPAVAGSYSEHPLFRVAGEASTHGIPTRVLDYVVEHDDIAVEFRRDGRGQILAYLPEEDTLRLPEATRVEDGSGNAWADPQLWRKPELFMRDAFRESFRAYWDRENYAGRRVYWAEDLIAAIQADHDRGTYGRLGDEEAWGYLEDAIARAFADMVLAAYSSSERSVAAALRHLRNPAPGDPTLTPATAGERVGERIDEAVRAVFQGPIWAEAYDRGPLLVDIGDAGHRFIEDHLLGLSLDAFIAAVQGSARRSIEEGLREPPPPPARPGKP